MSWYNPLTWFNFLPLPPKDPIDRCGYFWVALPQDHPFTPACDLHDYDFSLARAGKPEHARDVSDALLFYRWSLIASKEQNPQKRIELLWDIIKYWPIAREGGNLLWPNSD